MLQSPTIFALQIVSSNMKKQFFFVPENILQKKLSGYVKLRMKSLNGPKRPFHPINRTDEIPHHDKKNDSFMLPYPSRICQPFENFEENFFHNFFFSKKKWGKIQSPLFTSWMNMTIIPLNSEKKGCHHELINSNLSGPLFFRVDPVMSLGVSFEIKLRTTLITLLHSLRKYV